MDKYNNFLQTVQKGIDESTGFSCFDIAQTCCTNADIMRILTENDEEIKPFAIINLKSIENKKEADILLSHLICHDGRTREAVSFILDEIGEEIFYCDEKSIDILIKGLLDINPNVVRFLINFIAKSKKLKIKITPFVIAKTKEILEKLEIYS
ncbi:MAG: hypothetical protein LUE64_00750 [Candidatus Gastranaerophilales bacterium]|nr:hypothetical protein [Candidatus Gastranaerophilales bacterium]